MPTRLQPHAIDSSTYAIVVSFLDETGAPMSPKSPIAWTLTDRAGTVINDRAGEEQVIGTGVTSTTIVLHGDDLAVDRDTVFLLTISGTYNSSLGSDLEFVDQVEFTVKHLVGVD